jgi:hypothetical protein
MVSAGLTAALVVGQGVRTLALGLEIIRFEIVI